LARWRIAATQALAGIAAASCCCFHKGLKRAHARSPPAAIPTAPTAGASIAAMSTSARSQGASAPPARLNNSNGNAASTPPRAPVISAAAALFEAARAAFEAAWQDYLPKRTEADFQAWREHVGDATGTERGSRHDVTCKKGAPSTSSHESFRLQRRRP